MPSLSCSSFLFPNSIAAAASTLAVFGHRRPPRLDVRKWLDRGGPARYRGDMLPDSRKLYRALAARDPRFDGLFFVAVTSTKIYCRPICPAKTPREANTRFYA